MKEFGTLEYVLDNYSKNWTWKLTGSRAVSMVARVIPQAWYGEGPEEAMVPDTVQNVEKIKWIMETYPLDIKSRNIWQRKTRHMKVPKKKWTRIERLRKANPGKQFRGTLLNFQREGLDFLLKSSGNALLADEMGLGKCVHPDTLISTASGQITIKEIWAKAKITDKNGNEEWASLGTPIKVESFDGRNIVTKNVSRVFRQKIYEDVTEITLADGSSITCTKRHRLYTPEGWKMAGKLTIDDKVAIPSKALHIEKSRPPKVEESNAWQISEGCEYFKNDTHVHGRNVQLAVSVCNKLESLHSYEFASKLQEMSLESINWCSIKSVKIWHHAGHVYDLSVPGTHNYIANGMIAHNTIQTLSYLATEKQPFPVLIVAPLVTLTNWQREIQKFLKRRSKNGRIVEGEYPASTLIRTGKRQEIPSHDIYIINYDLLYKRLDDLANLGIKTIVCDEVQHLRSKSTKKYSAVKKLAGLDTVKYRIGLSGTPIYNRGSEIWPIVDILRPGLLGSFEEFCEYFCYVNEKGKAIVLENKRASLGEELRKHVMLRRKKSDVLKELKEKVRYKEFIDSDINYYYSELDKIWKRLEEEQKAATSAFDKFSSYKRAIQSERQAAGAAKLPHVIEFVKNIMEIEESVVVFCHHKAIHALLHKSLHEYSPASIIGGQSDKERQDNIDRFQNGETKLMIAGLRAGNVGINLSVARYVVFAELDWSPAIHRQAEDRCIKQGQLVNVMNKGLIEIEKVKLNDKVLTHLGNWKKVQNIKRREHRGLMTEIAYYRYSKPLICTHDHKIFVLKQNQTKPRWINAHEILPGDFVLMPIPTKITDKTFVEIPKECFHNPTQTNQFGAISNNGRYIQIQRRTELDHDLLYLFGWYVAEGFSSTSDGKGRFISLSGHIKEKPILEKLGERLKKFGVTYSINCVENKAELRSYSIELAKWFSLWFGRTSHEKRIPEFILDLPIQKLKTFFDAYCKGDGYFRNNQQEWVSVSRQLASQINLISLKCGFIPSLREIDNGKNHGQWIGGYTTNGNSSNKKLNKIDSDFCYHPVKRVATYHDKTTVYDLTVEDDHSFVVGQASVHNCHRIGQKNTVFAYYLIGNGTLDDHVANVLVDKSYEIDAIMDEKEEPFENKDKAELILAQIHDRLRTKDSVAVQIKA